MNKGEQPHNGERRRTGKTRLIDDTSVAIAALNFFAEDTGQADRFFTWAGLDARSLRQAAGQPGFGSSVLDYFMQDEALMVSFAAHAGHDPADLVATYEAARAREQAWEADV